MQDSNKAKRINTRIGQFPSSWAVTSFKKHGLSVIDGDRGKEYPKEGEFACAGHCLFLSAKNVTKSGFRFDECQFITEKKDNLLRKGKLKRDDIVITTRGTVGNIAWYNEKIPLEHIRINSGMAVIRKNGIDADTQYLYQFFSSELFQHQVKKIAFGSAQPQLTIKEINLFQIPLPPLPEQKKIAEILSCWDSAIETIEKLIDAKTRFKLGLQKLVLNGGVHFSSHKTTWTEVKLEDCLTEIRGGGTPSKKKADFWDGAVPWATVKDLTSENREDTQDHISLEGLKNSSSKMIPAGTVLLATRMAVGKIAKFKVDVAINQDLKALFPSSLVTQAFLFYLMDSLSGKLARLGAGSTVSGIRLEQLRNVRVRVPDLETQYLITRLLDNVTDELKFLSSILRKERIYKKGLMQQLLTGKIRVSTSESSTQSTQEEYAHV